MPHIGRRSLVALIKKVRRRLVAKKPPADVGGDRGAENRAMHAVIEEARASVQDRQHAHAVRQLEDLIATYGERTPAAAYSLLGLTYRSLGELGRAGAVLERGRILFPDDPRFMTGWAELAMTERLWTEAVLRWEAVIARFGDRAPANVYGRMAAAHWQQRDFDEAARALERGTRVAPRHVRLAMAWAQLAMAQLDWPTAAAKWEEVIETYGDEAPAMAYDRLGSTYRELGDTPAMAAIIERGLDRFPHEPALATAWAHVAMIERDWLEAIGRWDRVVANIERKHRGRPPRYRLPRQGPTLAWHAAAWETLTSSWLDAGADFAPTPSASLFIAVAQVLEDMGSLDLADQLLRLGSTVHAGDRRLAHALARSEVIRSSRERLLASTAQPGATRLRISKANAATLARFAVAQPENQVSLYRIRLPRGSSIELELHAGRYYTNRVADDQIRLLAERDDWPELWRGADPLNEQARRIADEYGQRFAQPPDLPAHVLSDAVFPLLYSELCVYEPVRRLAAVIAAEDSDEPVFIEAGGATNYLAYQTDSGFALIYFYCELRRRGVNAFLCQTLDPRAAEAAEAGIGEAVPPLRFKPAPSLLQTRPVPKPDDDKVGDEAIVPAGIRSIERVVGRIGDPLVYSSAFFMQEFAYDRRARSAPTLLPIASVHPPRSLLPEISLDMWQATSLSGVSATDENQPVTAPIDVSPPQHQDWLAWMAHAIQPFLTEIARRSHVEVGRRGIRQAHVCDHLFPESALFAAAVSAAGGSVTLWPHSANPVHADVRRSGSFSEVHAVTAAGCDEWQHKFPDVGVIHSPSLMLPVPAEPATPLQDAAEAEDDEVPAVASTTAPVTIDETQPLSVIVFGNRSVIGKMPVLHQGQHEEAYRRLFRGLEDLQASLPINVFYKPKGVNGETEAWLERVVGRTASWEVVVEHPLRITLTNMLFVAVSAGTSALLEGLGRGIPCAVVRDFPVRDYTTLEPGAIPIGSTPEVLKVVADSARGGLRDLAGAQRAYYLAQIGHARAATG